MEIQIKNLKPKKILNYAIFLSTLAVVLIALTTVVFPSLVIRLVGGFEDYARINPFETGVWAYPLLVVDALIFLTAVLHFKNKLPESLAKPIKFIFNFEVSSQVAILVIITLIGFYILFSVTEILKEEIWQDYPITVKPVLEKWTIADVTKGFELHVRYFLITTSMHIFGNYKVVPFMESIALLVLTYFFTSKITKKRFAGLVSMVIVLQSGTFLVFDTSTTYDNSWVLFYLLSLYMILMKWPASPVSFVLSLFSKPLTSIYLPMTFFFTYRADISKRKKIFLILSYVIIIIIGVMFLLTGLKVVGTSSLSLKSFAFWMAVNAISFQLRYDGLLLIFLLPLVVGLFIALKRGIAYADSMMLFIMGMLLTQPILVGITDQHTEPYRFMSLVIFFAVGVGTLLSKNTGKA